VTIESLAIPPEEDWPLGTFTDDQINRSRSSGREWNGDVLAAFAVHQQGAVTSFEPEAFDVGTDCLRDTEAVQGQKRDQGMVASAGETGSDQHRADLIAVQAGGRWTHSRGVVGAHGPLGTGPVVLLRRRSGTGW
jgi:hypothetical protein